MFDLEVVMLPYLFWRLITSSRMVVRLGRETGVRKLVRYTMFRSIA